MGTTHAPPNPADRRRDALQRGKVTALANRQARAVLLGRVAAAPSRRQGHQLAAEFVEDTPGVMAGLDVLVLVRRVPGVTDRGPSAGRMLEAAGIYGAKRMRDLTYGQRCALAAVLRAAA